MTAYRYEVHELKPDDTTTVADRFTRLGHALAYARRLNENTPNRYDVHDTRLGTWGLDPCDHAPGSVPVER